MEPAFIPSMMLLALICATPASSQSKINIIGGDHIDIGTVFEDSVVHETILVANLGAETLTVRSVRTSCGCTVAKPPTDIVAAHDTMRIPVQFNTKGFDGPVRKDIYFETNDSSRLHVDFVILANVKAKIQRLPRYLDFNISRVESTVTRVDTLLNNTSHPVTIDSVRPKDIRIAASISNSIIPPGGRVFLTCRFVSSRPGSAFGQVILYTSDPSIGEIAVSFKARTTR